MATLQDFGYKRWEAPRTIPVLVITVHYPGHPPLDPNLTFDELIFGSLNSKKKSVVKYYDEVSQGRFKWGRVDVVGPLNLSAQIRDETDSRKRAAAIIDDVAKAFDFSQVEKDGDKQIAGWELAIIVIESGGSNGGSLRVMDPPTVAGVKEPVILAGNKIQLETLCHELSHFLRGIEMYGEWNKANLNNRLTLMGTTIGATGVWHLDPWHKMQYGWLEPRIRALEEPRSESLAAASGFGDAVILYSTERSTQEFFMVEYRSPNVGDYDTDVAGNGLVIWHVVPDGCPDAADPLALSSPDFEHGGNNVWQGGQTTPRLQWSDGTDTGVLLSVPPFVPGADSITFTWDRAEEP
jgi:M6 family metalloprotease-like protein